MLSGKRLEDDFEKLSTIGRGSYGVVYRVRRKGSGDILALKRVRLHRNVHGFEDGVPSSSLREIAALKSLKHPNILQLLEIIHTGANLYLLFEHLDQDLKRTLDESPTGLGLNVTRNYMWQLLKAIAFCHSRRILHRDLKLQNLLVNRDGTIKLADFGLARAIAMPPRNCTKEVVTLWYRAPELLLGSTIYGPAIDVWSLGGICFEMITKKVLFPGDSEIDQLFKIFQVLGTPTSEQWANITTFPHYKPDFPRFPRKKLEKLLNDGSVRCGSETCDFLDKMLTYDPAKRISAPEALRHHFFDDLTKRPSLRDIQDPANVR